MGDAAASADCQRVFEEIRVVSPGNLLIKVEDFSLFSKHEMHKCESKAFEAGGIKWKLILCPEGGESEKEEDCHISVYFSVAETDSLPKGWEVNAVLAFFVYNHFTDNYLCFRGTTRRFNSLIPKCGFSKLVSKRSLMDPSNGYLVEDSCLFGAEIFVVKSERISQCLSLMKASSSTRRDWKISDFSKLESVWRSEEFELGDQKWKVAVHPNKGNSSTAKGRFVSIFVECVAAKSFAPYQKVKAEVFIRIKHKLDNVHHTRTYNHWFASSSPDWGYNEFISISDMSNKGFLVDDCCFLEIEIFVQALVLDDAPETPESE